MLVQERPQLRRRPAHHRHCVIRRRAAENAHVQKDSVRREKVDAIRQQIAQGTYVEGARVDALLDRLLADLH